MALHGYIFSAALLATVSALPACAYDAGESVGSDQEAVVGVGYNNISPEAVDSQALARGVTNSFGITTSSAADPTPLCKGGTVTGSGCTMKPEWESWLGADAGPRAWMMKGIAKCAVDSNFTITTADGTKSFPGQWGLFGGWKTNPLLGQDKRERMSACILALLNGNDESLALCIVGPGASPFSDACSDAGMTVREGGYFGDLFAQSPTAYVVGPDAAPETNDGRACFSTSGTYCCAETDSSCAHHIVLAGGMTGSGSRCNGFATSGSNEYCTSFFSTREPGRTYANVFTTFIPAL